MSSLLVTEPGSSLHEASGALELRVRGRRVRTVPCLGLTGVVLVGPVEVSAAARELVLQFGATMTYLGWDGSLLGRCEPVISRSSHRRRRQVEVVGGPAGLELARGAILGKLSNQRAVLLRRQRRLKDPGLTRVLADLRGMRDRAASAPSVEELRGFEGAGSARYFHGVALALARGDLRFEGRNHRPPRDPVNAALSFAYTLLLDHVIGACWKAGLDPYIGVLHHAGRGAPELALDLIEEWRPLVDRLVFGLFNRRQIALSDFRRPDPSEVAGEPADQACYLTRLGARIVAMELHATLASTILPHPLRGDSWKAKDLFLEQARQAAAMVDGASSTYRAVLLAL